MLDIARKTYIESVDDISDLAKQISQKYSLNIKPSFSATRGFFIKMFIDDGFSLVTDLPSEFIQVIRSKKHFSFTTSDLIKLNGRVNESLNEIFYISDEIISDLINSIRLEIPILFKLSENSAFIDMILSITLTSSTYKLVRPIFSYETEIKGCFHPLLVFKNKKNKVNLVANDIYFKMEKNILIITGPNMSGKSTYLKMVGLIHIMAQAGFFIPCISAKIRLCDRILTKMSHVDDLENNISTFTMEMKEVSYILQHSTENSLVLVDELGRGTCYSEAISFCHSFLDYYSSKKAFIMFATHFHDLCYLENLKINIVNLYFPEVDDKIREKQYKLEMGMFSIKDYGIRLAEKLFFPSEIIANAKSISSKYYQNQISDINYDIHKIYMLNNLFNELKKLLFVDEECIDSEYQKIKTSFLLKYYEN